MSRKVVATAIAGIVSIPLIPLLVTAIGHLTGTDRPMVFPTDSWTVENRPPLVIPPGSGNDAMLKLAERAAAKQNGFYVYLDADSGFNHGFPSGFFAAGSLDTSCIEDPAEKTSRCYSSPSATVLDRFAGTVTRVSFDPSPNFAGLIFEEPQNRGVWNAGSGFDLSSVSSVTFDVRSPAKRLPETLGLPLPTQTFGVVPAPATPPPADSVNRSVASVYESALTILALPALYDMPDAREIVSELDHAPNHDSGAWYISTTPAATSSCYSGNPAKPCGLHNAYISGDIALIGNESPSTAGRASDVRSVRFDVGTTPCGPTGPCRVLDERTRGAESAGKTGAAGPPSAGTDKSVAPGWYSLEVVGKDLAAHRQIEFEFVSDDGTRRRFTLESQGVLGNQRAAWIHFDRPGSLTVKAIGVEPTLRELGYAELGSRLRDITLAKAELTVFLLGEVLPILAWILTVCFLRAVSYWAIRRLPRMVRGKATHEVDAMFTFAKWAGVGCYLIWTVKDILSGVGFVFVT